MLIHLFRGLEFLTAAGEPIGPATRKAALLLAVLAMTMNAAPKAEVSQPTYKTKIERTIRVPMRDGVEPIVTYLLTTDAH